MGFNLEETKGMHSDHTHFSRYDRSLIQSVHYTIFIFNSTTCGVEYLNLWPLSREYKSFNYSLSNYYYIQILHITMNEDKYIKIFYIYIYISSRHFEFFLMIRYLLKLKAQVNINLQKPLGKFWNLTKTKKKSTL